MAQQERIALIAFVVSAPIAYGAFWYAGVFDEFKETKIKSAGGLERTCIRLSKRSGGSNRGSEATDCGGAVARTLLRIHVKTARGDSLRESVGGGERAHRVNHGGGAPTVRARRRATAAPGRRPARPVASQAAGRHARQPRPTA